MITLKNPFTPKYLSFHVKRLLAFSRGKYDILHKEHALKIFFQLKHRRNVYFRRKCFEIVFIGNQSYHSLCFDFIDSPLLLFSEPTPVDI